MKTLLLHIPKFNNYYRPIGDFIWLNYMPMGLLAIADLAHQNEHEVEVVHLGVEWVRNRSFRIDELIKGKTEIKAVGMALHWHYQAFDVIEAARRIRKIRKDIFIFLGGDTASFFHNEILREYPMIDAVVRGHGEKPFLGLLEALRDNRGLEKVPNISWRDGDRIRENRMDYVGDPEIVSSLNYTNFSLLRHSETYVRYVGLPFFFAKGFTKEWNQKHLTLGITSFPLPVGRGCPFNCTWCGGSQVPQHRFVSGLKGFIYRSHDSVIRTIRDALSAGYGIMHTGTDPEPETQEYFIELWRRLRREKIETRWLFESNGAPSSRFIEEFHKTFPDKLSAITVSPECGNEDLRFQHKGPAITTRSLFETMDHMDRLGITTEVFFTFGLPGENEELLMETISLQRKIHKRYRHIRAVRTFAIEVEPGAPWQMEPERFGIVTNRRSFRDFYNAHSDYNQGAFTDFGYYIPGYFKKPLDPRRPYQDFAMRMQAIKCKNFCFIHPNPKKGGRPWKGRMFCHLTSRLIRLKPRNIYRPY